jgi:hypothetical protein
VDDFIGMVQGGAAHRRHVKRALLATLDTVFRHLAPGDNPFRQEPASDKKMQKGDATWATHKVLLGWLVDTLKMIIELPPHRLKRLFEIMDSVPPHQERTSVKKWQKLLGELRSMVLAVPGGKGMFSILQSVLTKRCDSTSRLRLTKPVHAILKNFRLLAQDLATRPTRLAELIPADRPLMLGAHNVAALGMGGIHVVPMEDGSVDPILWRPPFPPVIASRLVSSDNPTGNITNSELELAGSVAQLDVLSQQYDVREKTVHNSSDNVATVWWQRKGAVSSTGPTHRLLRLQALHQRHFRYAPLHDYIPGGANAMSDDCSRLWALTDNQLLDHFNSSFPQSRPWRLCQLRRQTRFSLISALLMTASKPESPLNEPKQWKTIGCDGMRSAWSLVSTPSRGVGISCPSPPSIR